MQELKVSYSGGNYVLPDKSLKDAKESTAYFKSAKALRCFLTQWWFSWVGFDFHREFKTANVKIWGHEG